MFHSFLFFPIIFFIYCSACLSCALIVAIVKVYLSLVAWDDQCKSLLPCPFEYICSHSSISTHAWFIVTPYEEKKRILNLSKCLFVNYILCKQLNCILYYLFLFLFFIKNIFQLLSIVLSKCLREKNIKNRSDIG